MANPTSTTTFKADISQLKAAMQQAGRSVKLAASEFKAATAGMDDWTQSAEGLQAKLKQLKTTLGAQKSQLGLLEEQLEKTEKEYGKNSAAADRVRMSINNQKAAIAKTEKEIGNYSEELQKAEKYGDNFSDTIDEMDSASAKASDGFTVMKGALANLVADGIRMAIDGFKELITDTIEVGKTFEKSMSSVQALSGASAEDMQLLSDTAKEFGASTQFSASEAADALGYMALAGWDAQTSASALGGVLDLAAASGMELASASDMVTDYMSAFGMEAKESSYFADLLAYAQANANTTAEGLGEAFKNSAANMNAAGQDIETVTSLISMMANQGLKGSEAGTALTAVMRDMTAKMEDGAISIGETSVAVQDANGNYRDLTDILKDVEKATNGLGDAEKASALSATFTSDSIKGLNLILNAGVDNAADFEAELRNCSGSASDMAKTMNDNLSGDLTALNSKIEGVKIQVYESLTPALRDAVAKISEVIDRVNWDDVGKKLGDLTVKAVNFATKVIDNADGIIDVLKAVGSTLATAFVVSKLLGFASAIGSLYTTFRTLKTATDAATTSQLLLNAAQAATPIGLVAAAVAGLAAGVIYLASKNKEVAETTVNLTEAEQEQIDKIVEMKQAYDDLKATRNENVSALETEFGYYNQLSDELDTLVDENGKVKAGYEDRVNFILTTLNEACGTEMQLIDGVIQNYKDEKAALDDLIETKKAEAILRANEEAYTTAIQKQQEALKSYVDAQELYKQKKAELSELESKYSKIQNMTTAEYMKQNNLMVSSTTAAEMLANEQTSLAEQIKGTKVALGESNVALHNAENTYTGYQTTIKNYEGLSAAIISGDQQKISDALSKQKYDFQTTETGTRETLENQVKNLRDNYNQMKRAVEEKAPGVTKEMLDEAEQMVHKAVAEYNKLPPQTEKATKKAGNSAAKGMASTKSANQKATTEVKKTVQNSIKDNGEMKKEGQQSGKKYASGVESTKSDSKKAGEANAKEAVKGASSQDDNAKKSGSNFSQGFINGIGSLFKSAFDKAKQLAQRAVSGVKEGQKEGSPSKLTYQSGVYFVQGYINGIVSQNGKLKKTVKDMVSSVVSELANLSNYNFDEVAENASNAYSDALTKKFDYAISKMEYQNEEKLAEFDDSIEKLTSEKATESAKLQTESDKKVKELETARDKAVKKLESDRDKAVKKIESDRDKKVKSLQKQIDKLGTSDADKKKKKQLQKEITSAKENATKKIKSTKENATKEINATKDAAKKNIEAEKESVQKQIDASNEAYDKLINNEEANKEAYQKASSEMISEYQAAMTEYQNQAQALIDDTINGITDRYNQRYDELINKQDDLINKLKSAGDLFEVSGAGIMTVNDLTEQTKQIKEYTSKLQEIKKKVSSELFDEIASFDMKEGSAYIDRLLSMSASELDAYNKAYTEKMEAAEKAGETIYKSDFDKLSSSYQNELKTAFNDLPKQLEELGIETMKGFINGLTENTDYMSKEIKTYISAMVDTFKKELKIKSPSRVMMELGDYTGTGFVDGIKETINNVKKAAISMADAVATPMDDLKANLGGIKTAVGSQNGIVPQNNSVVNNYNLVQNNTSPKSLNALETYQARRQQIAMIKALT